MAVQHPSMPGYRLYEYVLVISPNEDLRNRISTVRKEFSEKYKAPLSGQKPHITLATFVALGMMEERIRNRFRHIAMGAMPFKVELKNFGSFPSHTIFINIATKIPLQDLNKQLRTAQRLMKADPEQKPHFIADPYIAVSRKLKPWQYEKGWLEYSQMHFTARMIADSMLLLRRPQGEKSYQIVERFEFQNLPVTTRQGELFL